MQDTEYGEGEGERLARARWKTGKRDGEKWEKKDERDDGGD